MNAQERLTNPQPGLQDSFDPVYLGNPSVVSGLVAEYCSSVLDLVDAGGEAFSEGMRPLLQRYSDIFSGRSPNYKPVLGYNEVTLPAKAIADLGDFWTAQRGQFNDDPVAVLFWWLAVHLVDSNKKADGDAMLFEVMMKPHIQGLVQRLLGIEKRGS